MIFEIALGIVLAVIILANLDVIFGCAMVLLAIGAMLAIAGVVIFLLLQIMTPAQLWLIVGLLFVAWVVVKAHQAYQGKPKE